MRLQKVRQWLALFSTMCRLFLLSHIHGKALYPTLCHRGWTEPGKNEHAHYCVKREWHDYDCRCACGRRDVDGRTLFDAVMLWRAEGYLEKPIHKNVYAQILSEVRKGVKA